VRTSMKLYQKYLVLLLVLLIALSIYFYMQNQKEYVNRVHAVLINLLNKEIADEKAKAFNFAFALSQNETLKSCIKTKNKMQGYRILQEYMQALESFSGSQIHAQILTKDYIIFARSWDNRDAGLNVKKYRPDLQEMKKTKKPHLSFEAARKLVLIASIPIISDNEVIGFIEVIRRFTSLEEYFKKYDINLIALLDSKYENQAVLLSKHPRIENMIVANDGANVSQVAYLKTVGISKLLNQGKLEGKNHFYFAQSILNNDGEQIAYFVLVISKQKLKLFSAFESELDSFFTYARKDLYYSILKKSSDTGKFSCLLQEEMHNENNTKISRGKIQ